MDVPGSRTAWIAALTAAAIAGQAPGAPAAQLSASRAVTPDDFHVQSVALAATPSGGRSALLVAGNRLHPYDNRLLARLGRGTSFGASRRLDGGATSIRGARVAVGADGTVVAAWQATFANKEDVDERIVAVIATPGHGFGRPQTLASTSSSTVFFGDVVVGARGHAVVSWASQARGGTVARAAFRRPGRRFSAKQTLGFGAAPQLAVAPSGTTVAVWRTSIGATRAPAVAHASMPSAAARFGRATALPSGPDGYFSVDASSGPGGAAISRVVRLGAAPGSPYELRFARVGRAGPGLEVAIGLPAGRSIDEPAFGFPRRGGVAAAFWSQDSATPGLQLFAGGAGGTLVSLAAATSTPPAAGALADRALVVWGEKTGPGAARVRLAARVGPTWQRAITVSSGRAIRDVAIASGRDRALLAWVQRDRSYPGVVRLAEYRR